MGDIDLEMIRDVSAGAATFYVWVSVLYCIRHIGYVISALLSVNVSEYIHVENPMHITASSYHP